MSNSNENFVRIAKCRFCGKEMNQLLLNQRLKEIPEEQCFVEEPCDACKKRFKDHKFFIGDCGHSGFIKTEALKKLSTPADYKQLEKSPIFRMKKCFMCMGNIKKKNIKYI